jgi:hypothetical protein
MNSAAAMIIALVLIAAAMTFFGGPHRGSIDCHIEDGCFYADP